MDWGDGDMRGWRNTAPANSSKDSITVRLLGNVKSCPEIPIIFELKIFFLGGVPSRLILGTEIKKNRTGKSEEKS
jgi:hypothetical protein